MLMSISIFLFLDSTKAARNYPYSSYNWPWCQLSVQAVLTPLSLNHLFSAWLLLKKKKGGCRRWVRFSYSQSWVSLSLTSYKLQEYKISLKLNVQHSLRSELLAHKDYVHKH